MSTWCSDELVASRAADLYLSGLSDLIMVTGGVGPRNKLLKSTWSEATEAEHFAKIILSRKVPANKLLVEKTSTNTGENLSCSYNLLKNRQIKPDSITLVTKPYMERRAYASFQQQWPDRATKSQISSPIFDYQAYIKASTKSESELINAMVGNLQRIKQYPSLGYLVKQTIPRDVDQAYQFLVNQGYSKRLL